MLLTLKSFIYAQMRQIHFRPIVRDRKAYLLRLLHSKVRWSCLDAKAALRCAMGYPESL